MSLQGAPQLRARLRAVRQAFKPIGRTWADETARLARPMVPVRTGKTRSSIRVRNASQRRATVVGNFPVNFINAGTKAHEIEPKRAKTLRFTVGGRPRFAKRVRHPATRGNQFKLRAANAALRRSDLLGVLVRLWNDAA